MAEINLSPLKNAFSTLTEGFSDSPSELERDGLIQRFEYTLELCWKMSKRILLESGIEADVPKNIFRELAKAEWIEGAEVWILFIQARNKASHIYKNEVAEEVFSVIPNFIICAEKLIETLEEKNR